MRVRWTARRSNQSILKEVRWFDRIADSVNMNLRQGKTEGPGGAAVPGSQKSGLRDWTTTTSNTVIKWGLSQAHKDDLVSTYQSMGQTPH